MHTHSKNKTAAHNTQSTLNDFTSSRLNDRQMNVMKAHCKRIGVSFDVFTGNRIHVKCSSSRMYTGLFMLDLHGITQF